MLSQYLATSSGRVIPYSVEENERVFGEISEKNNFEPCFEKIIRNHEIGTLQWIKIGERGPGARI